MITHDKKLCFGSSPPGPWHSQSWWFFEWEGKVHHGGLWRQSALCLSVPVSLPVNLRENDFNWEAKAIKTTLPALLWVSWARLKPTPSCTMHNAFFMGFSWTDYWRWLSAYTGRMQTSMVFEIVAEIQKLSNSLQQWEKMSFSLKKLYFQDRNVFENCTFSSSQWISHCIILFSCSKLSPWFWSQCGCARAISHQSQGGLVLLLQYVLAATRRQ